MAKPLIDDDLWGLIRPLLPPPKPRRRRYPGRKRLDDRKVLTGIVFVLRSGIPWEMLPQEMGCGCGMTCWNRLREWQKKGVWERIYHAVLNRLHGVDQIDWSRAIVDSSSVRAVGAGEKKRPQSDGSRTRGEQASRDHGRRRSSLGGSTERGQRS
jgi:transposase